MASGSENVVYALERKHDIQTIQSEAHGLFYLQDEDRLGMGILTVVQGVPHYALLTKEQLKILIREIKDVYDVMFD